MTTNGHGAEDDRHDVERWREDAERIDDAKKLGVIAFVTSKQAIQRAGVADERSASIYFQNGQMVAEVSRLADTAERKYSELARKVDNSFRDLTQAISGPIASLGQRISMLEVGPMRQQMPSITDEELDEVPTEIRTRVIEQKSELNVMRSEFDKLKREKEDRDIKDVERVKVLAEEAEKSEKKERRFRERVGLVAAILAILGTIGAGAGYVATHTPEFSGAPTTTSGSAH